MKWTPHSRGLPVLPTSASLVRCVVWWQSEARVLSAFRRYEPLDLLLLAHGLCGGGLVMRPVGMDSPQHQSTIDPYIYLQLTRGAGHDHLLVKHRPRPKSENNNAEEIRTTVPGLVEAAMFVGDYLGYGDTPVPRTQVRVVQHAR